MKTPFLDGIRKVAESNNQLMLRAFDQIERLTGAMARPAPPSKKEPTHINFSDLMHYGVGRYGEHIGTQLKGSNIHVYKNKLFVLTPDGGAFTIPLSGEDANRAGVLLAMLRDRSAPWSSAS